MNKVKTAKPKKYRQNTNVAAHYHPRWLARAIVHQEMKNDGAARVNKREPGVQQSAFARLWREAADSFAR